jgi:hypothetical protein
LALTSTIRARPDSLKCVNSAILLEESARYNQSRSRIIGAHEKEGQAERGEAW